MKHRMLWTFVMSLTILFTAGCGKDGARGPAGPQGEQGLPGESFSWADVVEGAGINQSVYAIAIQIGGTNYLLGTAFAAHYENALWTNGHIAVALVNYMTQLQSLNPLPVAIRANCTVGGADTYILTRYSVHPGYTGETNSPDVALLAIEETLPGQLTIASVAEAENLKVGLPVATSGFPGEIEAMNTATPIPTFKDGTISALRPYNPDSLLPCPTNNHFIQHNLDLSGGTSGSPVFDTIGAVIGINNSGTERVVIDQNTGQPTRIPSGNIGFAIRIDEVWTMIDAMTPAAKRTGTGTRLTHAATHPLDDRSGIGVMQ